MPKRTNEFQELVALVKRAYAKHGDTVTESAMVKVFGLKKEREIDILHQTSDGLFTIKIAVEARDEGRPMDQTRFEALCGKYFGPHPVKVDKLVIVTRNGFSSNVVMKANLAGIGLLTLDKVANFDWRSLGPQHGNLARPATLNLSVPPHIHSVMIRPSIPTDVDNAISVEGRLICPHGHDHGSPSQLAIHCLFHQPAPETRSHLQKLQETAKLGTGGAFATVTFPLPNYVVRFRGQDHPTTQMEVQLHAINATAPLECTPYELTDAEGRKRLLQHATTVVGNQKVSWVMPDGLHSKQIALKIDDVPKTPKQKAAERRKERRKQSKRIRTPRSKKRNSDK